MVGKFEAVATVAVRDLKVSRRFYEDTLGLGPNASDREEVLAYDTGGSKFFVYVSEFAGTNKATAVTWMVENVGKIAKALKAKGVVFEHYDLPGMKRKGDVHSGGDMEAAWFKDPDGNIHAIVSG